ncbi:hypothetical protein GWZ30_22070 [Salmonella enterica subsp. enterica serovar Adelaide]|nr:hypothetical protein [Salmonella enterica]ECF4099660.1 hypothetical protein [Salmonella enterica subsp. enterica serovar Adelaide]EEG1525191.1 hypothetical protein [Salmonella enterica subsp. enterica serovar Adelaide]EEJ0752143.1 hypothetical protein [Salmonella enterica]EJU6064450.1 pheA operon leader peptide PheL [Salmonella enterica]
MKLTRFFFPFFFIFP